MLTDEQKKARIGRVTSSIVSAVLGRNPFTSPRMAKERILGRSDFEGNEYTRWGDIAEPAMLQHVRDTLGVGVLVPPFKPIDDWAGDSADGVVVAPEKAENPGKVLAVVECKTASYDWGDEVPEHYVDQCHWHMLAYPTSKYCLVPVIFGGRVPRLEMYEVPRDEERISEMVEAAQAWHQQYIINDEEVPVSHQDLEEVRSSYDIADVTIEDEMLGALVREYKSIDEQAKNLSNLAKKIEARIMERMDGAKKATFSGGSITLARTRGASRLDTKALQAEAQEDPGLAQILAGFTKEYPGHIRKTIKLTAKDKEQAA